jgi:hypothetical protein
MENWNGYLNILSSIAQQIQMETHQITLGVISERQILMKSNYFVDFNIWLK